ncbi:MAG: vitamin K epoxide reductase [uncultured bacterium]|nr:MAG: vitamin K epoxide reductase [uncultured bacterium]HAU65595.1 hypothetical protein [Candidatus Woesebacteria bacterium]HCC09037.1 hypothetical protein [Candidatus Woesebacteria bacterium]
MKEKFFNWIKILAGLGIFLALFLLWEQIFRPSFQPCNINATVNCDAVISGEVSKTLGIPTPLIGLVGYIIILFAAFKKNAKLVLGMAAFGLAFCLYIAYRELFQLHVICPVCVLCQLDMITVFILGILLNRKASKPIPTDPIA